MSYCPGPSTPDRSFPCQGRFTDSAPLLSKNDYGETFVVEGVHFHKGESVEVLGCFEDPDTDTFLYQLAQGWVRKGFVQFQSEASLSAPAGGEALPSHPLPQKPQAKSEERAWIRRNGGANVGLGGETSVKIYSGTPDTKPDRVCLLQNDVAVKRVGIVGDWSQIKYFSTAHEEATGWVKTVHLTFFHLITEQPRMESRAFAAGCRLYLSVQTDDRPGLKYQWQLRKQNAKESEGFANITSEGSDKRIFVIKAAHPNHSGSYRVIVSKTTGSNDQEYSDLVQFVVISPPAGSPSQKSQAGRVVRPTSSTFNVLLMGETGTGKSTFVNLLANHFAPSSFSDKKDIKVAIPTAHLKVSAEYSSYKGSEAGGAACVAQTQTCCTYSMTKPVLGRGRCTFNFIDSPGLNDPRGKEQDDKVGTVDVLNLSSSNFLLYVRLQNLHNILQTLEELDEKGEKLGLNALVFVLNGTNPRFTINIQNMLAKLKGYMPDAIISHVILVFTKVSSHLQCPVPYEEVVKMLALPSNHGAERFYVNCSAFIHDPDEWKPDEWKQIQAEWNVCNRELAGLVQHITQIPQHGITAKVFCKIKEHRLALNAAMHKARVEMKNLLELMKQIKQCEHQMGEEKHNQQAFANFMTEANVTIEEIVDADYHSTICSACNYWCHEKCGLNEISQKGSNMFKGCQAFHHETNCSRCPLRCSYETHYHARKKKQTKTTKVSKILDDIKAKFDKAGMKLADLGKRVSPLEDARKQVEAAMASVGRDVTKECQKLKLLIHNFNFAEELHIELRNLRNVAEQSYDLKIKTNLIQQAEVLERIIQAMQDDPVQKQTAPVLQNTSKRSTLPQKGTKELAREEAPISCDILLGIDAAIWISRGFDDRNLPGLLEKLSKDHCLSEDQRALLNMYVLILQPKQELPPNWIRLKHNEHVFFADLVTSAAQWDNPNAAHEPVLPIQPLNSQQNKCLLKSLEAMENKKFSSVSGQDCLGNASLDAYPHKSAWQFFCEVSCLVSAEKTGSQKNAEKYLDHYKKVISELWNSAKTIDEDFNVDPLFLLAQARFERFKGRLPQATALYALFRVRFPGLSEKFLWENEKEDAAILNPISAPVITEPLVDLWEKMKTNYGFCSDAMEILLHNYDGQINVKSKILDILQEFQAMKMQGCEYGIEMNAVFLGNPGTGEIYRIFAFKFVAKFL